MADIYTILDNITEYRDDIDNLVRQLKDLDINSLEEFRQAAKEAGTAVPADIQSAVGDKFAHSDEDDWNESKERNTEESYQHYLFSHPDGAFRDDARSAIDRLRDEAAIDAADKEWANVDKSSIDDLSRFVKNYPNSAYVSEAKELLRDLKRDEYIGVGIRALAKQISDIQTDKNVNNPELEIYEKIVSYLDSGKLTIDDFLQALKEDHNFISCTVAKLLWENGFVNDFSAADIDARFIEYMLSDKSATSFSPSTKLERIHKPSCTEIYFWGIPSSGKSCALGAILSAANNGKVALSMSKDNDCQGYGYMTRLSNLFKNNGSVGTLPEGTAVTSTYEMSFELEDQNHNVHPITCIDLAGELVRCMYKNDAKEGLTVQQEEVLKTLTNILIDNRTQNRKIHFFVIEYGAEDRQYEGLPQLDYLQAAVAYIQRTGIFKKDTDGLYLLITKVDKAKAHGKELIEKLRQYINDNYQGFYNGLKKVCRDNEINGGEVEIIPFSLGEVCFQSYCKFNDRAAANVVNKILDRSYGYKPGKLRDILGKLKK